MTSSKNVGIFVSLFALLVFSTLSVVNSPWGLKAFEDNYTITSGHNLVAALKIFKEYFYSYLKNYFHMPARGGVFGNEV